MKLPLETAIAAASAQPFDIDSAPHDVRVCTDTRQLREGDAFLALRGERFDGHAFAEEAKRRGAALLIVESADARILGMPALVVADTLRAYMALAAAARDRFQGRVLAITGSAGKTTTKAFVSQLLAARYGSRVLASPANENNEIGVSKLLLDASDDEHDVVVAEMGARHYGDIAALVTIARPEVGVLTNVGEAHLEIMGSRERLEETKWALFGRGARAVLNADDEASVRRAPTLDEQPHWFSLGADSAQLRSLAAFRQARGDAKLTLLAQRCLIEVRNGASTERAVGVRVPGLHNRANLAAAIAGALELGVPLDALVSLIPSVRLPPGRFEPIELHGGPRLIYDAYNANASGTIAALDAFALEPGTRHIAVLGSMAELGDASEALHERVGEHAAGKVDVLLVGGEHADALARGAVRAGLSSKNVVPFATNEEAVRWLRQHADPGDTVLLKASRKYKLEEIVDELREERAVP